MGEYLRPLLDFAASVIPPFQHANTPIYLLATAGMRLLPPNQRNDILLRTCAYIQSSFAFSLPDCAENIRVITGEEEGLYGWIAVNYLMDGFDKHDHSTTGTDAARESSTYGFLDMGGASAQIAFEPSHAEQVNHADNLVEVKLRLLNGREVRHPVFVTTWLGFGTNQARERYIDQEIKAHLRASDEAHVHSAGSPSSVVFVDDPCLPKSLMLSESRHSGYTLRGTGDFGACVRKTEPLLNKEVACHDQPCLFNGVHAPPIDFDVNHFIGISEYWYSTQDVWKMGNVYDFVAFEKNAEEYCSREWDDIMVDHKTGTKWHSGVELARLESQCFKAAWVTNILHEGIGIPRIIDQGGQGDRVNQTEKGLQLAEEKGLLPHRPPSFQSLNHVGDVAISWTLGKMVLEVSRQAAGGRAALAADRGSDKGKTRFPAFNADWAAGHIPAWSGDVRSTLAAVKNADPVPIFGVALFVMFLWAFCLSSASSRRRKSFFGGVFGSAKRRPTDFGLEEGGMSSGDSSSGSRSPPARGGSRRPNLVTRALAPMRFAAYYLSSTLRSWSRPRNSSLLPTSTSSARLAPQPDDIHRPRPLRQSKSTPFMRVISTGGPVASTAGSTTTTHWNDVPEMLSVGNSITRSHSSSILTSTSSTNLRSVSPPPMSSNGPLASRPTTPSRASSLKLSALTPASSTSALPSPARTSFSSMELDEQTFAQSSSRRDPGTPPTTDFGSPVLWESLGPGVGSGMSDQFQFSSGYDGSSSPTMGIGGGYGVNAAAVGVKLRASKSANGSQVNLVGYRRSREGAD